MRQRVRASAVVVHEGKLLTVRLEDPQTKITRHFVPGGLVELNESPAQTAVRETREEAGIEIELTPQPPHIAIYPFVWNNVTYECKTSFFAAICANPHLAEVHDVDYNKGAEWVPLTNLEAYLGFDQQIFSAVQAVIRSAFPNL